MTTAVTGATGRAGSEIVRGSLARGDAVAALVRDPAWAQGIVATPDLTGRVLMAGRRLPPERVGLVLDHLAAELNSNRRGRPACRWGRPAGCITTA